MRNRNFAAGLSLLQNYLVMHEPEFPVLKDMAGCYWGIGDDITTMRLMQSMVQAWPDNPEVWNDLGVYLMMTGHKQAACSALDTALKLSPKSVSAICARNFIEPFDTRSRYVQTLRRVTTSKTSSSRERVHAHSALGIVHDHAGQYGEAFRHFGRANARRKEPYEKHRVEKLVAAQIRRCPRFPLMMVGHPSVIFVAGLPRSGTTLVDRILSRHSEVRSVGESHALTDTLRAFRSHLGSRYGRLDYYAWVDFIETEDMTPFREMFFDANAASPRETGSVIVSKMPLDCLEMGFARALIPDARFVFVNRHPLDVGLSLYRTNFKSGHGFTRKLGWIGHMMRHVYLSLDNYKQRLGPALRVQSYRRLVEAPQEQVIDLLTHCGLSFEPGCMEPEKGHGSVRTASLLQVRASINRSGLGKWHRYATQLEPLVAALGGQSWLDDWALRDLEAASGVTISQRKAS
ncbi:hypothetical protein BFP70_03790 [Thioclava sp. SK-1]|nr:hypothetical protein BFP70_03790 [Thioclava sp. SK-1]